jgi:hypothetical protein
MKTAHNHDASALMGSQPSKIAESQAPSPFVQIPISPLIPPEVDSVFSEFPDLSLEDKIRIMPLVAKGHDAYAVAIYYRTYDGDMSAVRDVFESD